MNTKKESSIEESVDHCFESWDGGFELSGGEVSLC